MTKLVGLGYEERLKIFILPSLRTRRERDVIITLNSEKLPNVDKGFSEFGWRGRGHKSKFKKKNK